VPSEPRYPPSLSPSESASRSMPGVVRTDDSARSSGKYRTYSVSRILGTPMTVPADGRLRGMDYTAQVSGVAWPTAAGVGTRLGVLGSLEGIRSARSEGFEPPTF
jgi:hypothetical protein